MRPKKYKFRLLVVLCIKMVEQVRMMHLLRVAAVQMDSQEIDATDIA